MRILQLGCGEKALSVAPGDELVRVDKGAQVNPTVVHDLNQFPYPFATDTFDVVDATDVLEHLDDLVRVMEEIFRVARPGARVRIATPHFSSANSWTDPTHRHHLGFFSFDYFTGENEWGFYTRARFKKVHATIVFYPGLVNAVVRRLARWWPAFYERRLTWIFPAWFLSFELEVTKPFAPNEGKHP